MTNPIAFVLGALLVAAAAADVLLNGGRAIMFLFGELTYVVDKLVFWR